MMVLEAGKYKTRLPSPARTVLHIITMLKVPGGESLCCSANWSLVQEKRAKAAGAS